MAEAEADAGAAEAFTTLEAGGIDGLAAEERVDVVVVEVGVGVAVVEDLAVVEPGVGVLTGRGWDIGVSYRI